MKNKNAQLVRGYWRNSSLEELHHRSRIWLSELAFWKGELLFMQKLVNNHFVFFIEKAHAKETFALLNHIKDLETALADLEGKVCEHEKHLTAVILQPSKKQEKAYRTEHGTLEEILDGFISKYRDTKKALFQEADQVLKEENRKRLTSLTA